MKASININMSNDYYIVEHLCNELSTEWDRFVDESNGTVYQTSVYASLNKDQYNSDYHYIIVREKNQSIVAGCIINTKKFPIYGKVGYVWRGPCFKNMSEELSELLIGEIQKFATKQRLTYVAVSLNYNENELWKSLLLNGFFPKDKHTPPSFYLTRIEATLVIDLKPSVEDIFNQMKKNQKKKIRKGLKSPVDVKIRMGGRNDLEYVYRLMQNVCTSHNGNITISLKELYYLWDNLSPAGQILMFLGEVEGKVVCSDICFAIGKTIQADYWGWNREYEEYEVAAVFQWKEIEYVKERGFEWYNFGEIDTLSYMAILEDRVNDSIKEGYFFGATFHKMRWGGIIKEYASILAFYPNIFKRKYIESIVAVKNGRLWAMVRNIIMRRLSPDTFSR